MSATEIKAAIYKMLDTTDDNTVLEDIHEYIAQRKDGYIPELGCTLEEYNRDLDEAMEEIKRGEYVSHEEAMRQIDEMLQRKRDESKLEQ